MHKQEIGLLWSSESFEVKNSIGFGITIEIPSKKKNLQHSQKEFRSIDINKQKYCNVMTLSGNWTAEKNVFALSGIKLRHALVYNTDQTTD